LTLRFAAFQVLTWGTIVGAVACAVLLAVFDIPVPPLDGSSDTLSTPWPPTQAGLASAGPVASAPPGRRR
jgi:Zn-dependent protease